ncbi:Eukaryotic translation initiation factor 4B [Blastocladiella emersonii ATCC 22665]|nr:Eukaryotic translation initiation factor 4B [Blastocladiella emersonii ATCC 22665]
MSKKLKGTKLSAAEFLSSENSWADDEHDLPSSLPGAPIALPSAPGALAAEGGPARPQKPLPTGPPYTAFVGNLSYEVDDDTLGSFFYEVGQCEIVQPRVVRDRESGQPKGFGYIEFADIESLKRALALDGFEVIDRQIRVDVADTTQSASGASRNRSGFGGFSGGAEMREERAAGAINWRREAPVDFVPAQQSGFGGPRRGGFGDRAERPAGGFGSDRPPREDRPNPFDNFSRPAPAAPVERKKLDLAPRTKPVEAPKPVAAPAPAAAAEPAAAAAPAPEQPAKKKFNPFGAAKPVDTQSKLLDVEKKLAQTKIAEPAAAAGSEEKPASPAGSASSPTDRTRSPGPRGAPGARGARDSATRGRGGAHGLPERKATYGWGKSAREMKAAKEDEQPRAKSPAPRAKSGTRAKSPKPE